jgi:hypothetical protein
VLIQISYFSSTEGTSNFNNKPTNSIVTPNPAIASAAFGIVSRCNAIVGHYNMIVAGHNAFVIGCNGIATRRSLIAAIDSTCRFAA